MVRSLRVALVGLILLPGCSLRLPGMQDPNVEIARILAASQASSIKALTDALTAAQKTACEVR